MYLPRTVQDVLHSMAEELNLHDSSSPLPQYLTLSQIRILLAAEKLIKVTRCEFLPPANEIAGK